MADDIGVFVQILQQEPLTSETSIIVLSAKFVLGSLVNWANQLKY